MNNIDKFTIGQNYWVNGILCVCKEVNKDRTAKMFDAARPYLLLFSSLPVTHDTLKIEHYNRLLIGSLHLDKPIHILGFCKLNKNEKYNIPKGLYPIVYFEEISVQISVEDEHDFMWIDRKDMEWIDVSDIKLE
jgi:hypothetical protein